MGDALEKARELTRDVTPLKKDCGKVCGARCCRSLEEEETGMLLFPGEEDRYRDQPGWKLKQTAAGTLAVCPGTCDRNERPLACRIFPLLRQGIRGMDPAFTETVREAGKVLAEDPRQRAFLEALTEEQDELKTLREKLGGL